MTKNEKIQTLRCGNISASVIFSCDKISEEDLLKTLLPAEIDKANSFGSNKRKSEFKKSRWLIRQFINPKEPLISPKGVSYLNWPEGTIASLSHKKDAIAFAIVSNEKYLGLGIDVEYCHGVKEKLAPKICSESEIEYLKKICDESDKGFDVLLSVLFSFKEAVFKAIFPLGNIWFYFDDFEVCKIDLADGRIEGCLLKTASQFNAKNSIITGSFNFFTPPTSAVETSISKETLVLTVCSILKKPSEL